VTKILKINVRCPRAGAIWTVSSGATIPTAGIKASGATKNQETVKLAEEFGVPADGCLRGREDEFGDTKDKSLFNLFVLKALTQKLSKSFLCLVISRFFFI